MELILKKFTDAISHLHLPAEKFEKYKQELAALIYFAYATEVFEYCSPEEIQQIKNSTGDNIEELVEFFKEKQLSMNNLHSEITVELVGLPILEDYLKNVFNVSDSVTSDQRHAIIDIYTEAISKIKDLGIERQSIIKQYIKELEEKKIELLKQSLYNQ